MILAVALGRARLRVVVRRDVLLGLLGGPVFPPLLRLVDLQGDAQLARQLGQTRIEPRDLSADAAAMGEAVGEGHHRLLLQLVVLSLHLLEERQQAAHGLLTR